MVLIENNVFERIRRSAQRAAKGDTRELKFHAMGTQCRLKFRITRTSDATAFEEHVLAWVANFEATYSRFLPDSLISRINANAGAAWVEIDPETEHLFDFCGQLVFTTRGAFDPTALPLIRLWNWKTEPPAIPTAAEIKVAQELVGWSKVQRRPGAVFLPRPGMSIDLGGIGKEFAVDRVLAMAMEHGIQDVLVDFGQDVRVHGQPADKPAWHIGLQDPKNPTRCWCGLAVRNHAVATSGDYIRSFTLNGKRYGHIIDPRSGYPVSNGCLAVSVIAPSCTVAGILSTSAFILGPQEGVGFITNFQGAEGCVVTERGTFTTRRFQSYVVS
jgi:FAD:protein FMN transferase